MKMKTAIAMIASIVLFASCSNPRYAYSPTAHNIPILTKQGDSKVGAYYSTSGFSILGEDEGEYDKNTSNGADVQGAVAVTNNIAVQANYSYRSEKTNSKDADYPFETSKVKYKRSFAEFGLGFFSPFGKNDQMIVQVFAGAGFGKTKMNDNGVKSGPVDYKNYYNMNVSKFYLEPSITFRAKEIFAASVATKFSIVKFGNISTDYTLDERQSLNLDSLNRYSVAFFEPTFVGSFGFNKMPGFRIEVQTGLSLLWNQSFFDYRPFNLSIGLVADIGKLMRGPKQD